MRDSVVRHFLTGELTGWRTDWLVWRHLAGDRAIVEALDDAAREVRSTRGFAGDGAILRVLDVALWTYAAPLSRQRGRHATGPPPED